MSKQAKLKRYYWFKETWSTKLNVTVSQSAAVCLANVTDSWPNFGEHENTRQTSILFGLIRKRKIAAAS